MGDMTAEEPQPDLPYPDEIMFETMGSTNVSVGDCLSTAGRKQSASLADFFSGESRQHHSKRFSKSRKQPRSVFVDAGAMKNKLRLQMCKREYNVTDFYKQAGACQRVARSSLFENFTLFVIILNAVWIAVDTELNTADVLLDSPIEFQIVEHGFCAYFSLELGIRFLSFRHKRNCLKDGWFVFDSSLVFLMVMETWVFTLLIIMTAGGSGPASVMDASVLRVGRLMRLSRMARMARLLRAMPELLILIKGMLAAVRSVGFTLVLLVVLMYAFGIAFKQLAVDTPAGIRYFGTLPSSMHTLMLRGTLLDGPSYITAAFVEDGTWYLLGLFYVYVLLSSLTVMNTLIGVLCEVVSAISETEKEQMTIAMVKAKLKHIMVDSGIDKNHDGNISEEEFKQMLENVEAAKILQEVGVDVVGLVDVAEFIFEDVEEDEAGERNLSFPKFVDVILNLRGSNTATVKDVVDLRKFMRLTVSSLDEAVHESLDGLCEELLDIFMPQSLLGGSSNEGRGESPSAPFTLSMSEHLEATLAAAQRSFHDSMSLARTAAGLGLQPEPPVSAMWVSYGDDTEAPFVNSCRFADYQTAPAGLQELHQKAEALAKRTVFAMEALQQPGSESPPEPAIVPLGRRSTRSVGSRPAFRVSIGSSQAITAPLGRKSMRSCGTGEPYKSTLLSKSMARRSVMMSNLAGAREAKRRVSIGSHTSIGSVGT